MSRYRAYCCAQWLAAHVPLSLSYRIAAVISRIRAAGCGRERRAVAANFLAITGAPPSGPDEIYRLYEHFSYYLVDFLRAHALTAADVRRNVDIQGLEHIDAGLRRGKGVIGLTAHIGNWELTGQILGLLGYPMNAVALTHQDPRINALFDRQRNIFGVKVLPFGGAVRHCFAALKRNQIVGLLGDRDFSEQRGISVPFCGRSLTMPRGPAVLSLRTDAAIVPGFVLRDEQRPEKFFYRLEPPLLPERSGDEEADVRRLSERCAQVMERYVREFTRQWFLFHEFWQPEPATRALARAAAGHL